MNNVLITGGAGFIGYFTAQKCLDRGYKVTLLDNLARGVIDSDLQELLKNPNIELIKADLCKDNLVELLRKHTFDYIYHYAAIIGVKHVSERPYDVLNLNHLMLTNMIEYARTQKNLKRFTFTSTSEIYIGSLEASLLNIPTEETNVLALPKLEAPRTSYMLSKIYGEALCLHSKLPVTIVRPHNFYGPRMGLSHVVPELLKKMYLGKSNETIEIASPEHTRTFCYIEDATEMIILLSENEYGLNSAFNIGCSSPEIKMIDLAELLKRTSKSSCSLKKGAGTVGSPSRRCPNMNKTFKTTDYTPRFSIEEGTLKTFEWYKKSVFDSKGVSAV